ncbi:MAG: hypothetical protein ACOCTG_03555 [Bacteroidota bacterium]
MCNPVHTSSSSRMFDRSARSLFAWILVSVFVGGAVLAPAVHHAFHPHGSGSLERASESIDWRSDESPAPITCVICKAPFAADDAGSNAPVEHELAEGFHSPTATEPALAAAISLPPRAPPTLA